MNLFVRLLFHFNFHLGLLTWFILDRYFEILFLNRDLLFRHGSQFHLRFDLNPHLFHHGLGHGLFDWVIYLWFLISRGLRSFLNEGVWYYRLDKRLLLF